MLYEDPIKAAKLYQSLMKDGYTADNLGSEEEFVKSIEDPTKAKKIYSSLVADGYTEDNLGSEVDFLGTFTKASQPEPVIADKKKVGKISYENQPLPQEPFQSVDPERQKQIEDYFGKKKEIDQQIKNVEDSWSITTSGRVEDGARAAYLKKQSEDYTKIMGKDGGKLERLYSDFKDLPEGNKIDFAQYQNELDQNEESYTRHVAALKWQRNLADAIVKKDGADLGKKVYDRLIQMQKFGGTYSQRKRFTDEIIKHVRSYVDDTDKQEEIIKNIAVDRAASYGSQLAYGSDDEFSGNPMSEVLNKYQIGALEFLRSVDPVKANAYARLLNVPADRLEPSFGDNTDMITGYESQARELESIGLSMALNSVMEDIKSLNNKGSLSDAEKSTYNKLVEKFNELDAEVSSQGDRYPTTRRMEVHRMTQEAMGESYNGIAKRFTLNVGKGVDNTFSFIETMGYKIFGSDADLRDHELRQLGASDLFSSVQSYVPNSNGFFQQNQLFDFSTIQPEIDAINNSKLSYEEKQAKMRDLMYRSYKDVKTIQNPEAEKINWTGTGVLEGMNSVISQMVPMVATAYLLPGSTASKAAQFRNMFTSSMLTTYEQQKVDNIRNKIANPETRALMTTVITSAAEGLNLDLPMFKKMFTGKGGILGKIASDVTEADWNAVVAASKGGFKNSIKRIVSATGANLFETIKESATEEIGTVTDKAVGNVAFGENNDMSQGLGNDFVITLVGLGIPSLAAVPFRYSNTGMDMKYGIWEIGTNADKIRSVIKKQVEDGVISPDRGKEWDVMINRAETAVNSTPPVKANGKMFTDSQKAKYAYNEFVKQETASQSEKAPESVSEKLAEVTKVAQEENDNIASGKDDERIIAEAKNESKKSFDPTPFKEMVSQINNDESISEPEREAKIDQVMNDWVKAEKDFNNPVAEKPVEAEQPATDAKPEVGTPSKPIVDNQAQPTAKSKPSASGRQELVNKLVDRVRQFREGDKRGKGRSQEENAIKIEAKNLGLKYDSKAMDLKNSAGKKVSKRNITTASAVIELDRSKYSKEVNDSVDKMLGDEGLAQFLGIVDDNGRRLSKKQISKALQSVKDGKFTDGSKRIFDKLAEAQENGYFEVEDISTGQKAQIPFESYFAEQQAASEEVESEILIDAWQPSITEDWFDEQISITKNEIENENSDTQSDTEQDQPGPETEQKNGGTERRGENPDGGKNIPTGSEQKNSDKGISAEEQLKSAQSELQSAKESLSKAEAKIAGESASQTDLFGATKQPGMFSIDPEEAQSILSPYKEAVKLAQKKVDDLQKKAKVEKDSDNPDIFDGGLNKAEKRKVRDEKARKEIDDALSDFFKTGTGLTVGGIDPVKLEKGLKVVSLYIKQGVTKFSDIVEDAYEKFGDLVKEMFSELKASYGAYYNNATDEEAALMDGNIRGVQFNDIIKPEQNVSDKPGDKPGYSDNTKDVVPSNEGTVSGDRGRGRVNRGKNAEGRREKDGSADGGKSNDDVLTPPVGEQSDQQLPEGIERPSDEIVDTGAFDGRGNSIDGTAGANEYDGTGSISTDNGASGSAKSFKERQQLNLIKQKAAESIAVKLMDEENIRETLPYLLPEQQDDVIKAEKRFFSEDHNTKDKAYGKGMMFTNGTGTGKTYVGLGIVKRFVRQGKGNVLIVTPSQPKVSDWAADGNNLGLNITPLEGTNTGGKGVVVTTFANFRTNEELLKRDFDLIVYDESHRLMEDKKGQTSSTTGTHYMMGNRDQFWAEQRLKSVHPLWKEQSALLETYRALNKSVNNDQAANPEETEKEIKAISKKLDELSVKIEKALPELQERARKSVGSTKVVFLSATPFKGHFNLRYANGFLFDWGEGEEVNSRGSRVDAESSFFLENFGSAYEWKYHRLQVKSDSSPDAVAMQEVAFSEKLMASGVMSGRAIESDRDYSREFPKVSGFNSEGFNKAFNDIYNYETKEFDGLRDAASKVFFNYNYTTQLFESLKTSMAIPRIKKHLDLGRQVVIFHRRKQANATPPFQSIYDQTIIDAKGILADDQSSGESKQKAAENIQQAEKFKIKYQDIFDYEKELDYRSVTEQVESAFPGQAGYINGDVSVKKKNEAIREFNTDGSKMNLIVIQEEAGKEGISLHDVTGKGQRVLISMSMPISTTTALQVEGRIYRIGQESDAIFEYPLLGLDLETAYFGQNINRRLSTTENMAMGNASRDLIRSYAEGVLFNSSVSDPSLEQGKGGKEYDKRVASSQTQFQKAKLVYATNQKNRGSRNQREGVDYFATAEPIGQKVVEWLYMKPSEHGLEPSAGHGAIAMWFPTSVSSTSIEPSFNLYSKLTARAGGGTRKVLNQQFEDHNIINKYHGIAMNPPFGVGGKTAMDHIEKAFKHLADGGRIVAIIPSGGSMQKRLEKFLYGNDEKGKPLNPNAFLRQEIQLPTVAFEQAGTSVSTRIVVIDRIDSTEDSQNIENGGKIDLSSAKTINELFDSIEFIDVPGRIYKKEDAPAAPSEETGPVSTPKTINEIEEITHSKTGEIMYSAKASRFLGDEYKTIDSKARENKGYYSRFTKSWLFKDKENAENFRSGINGTDGPLPMLADVNKRVSFSDLGITESDGVLGAIDKIIGNAPEFAGILGAIKADPNIEKVKLELNNSRSGPANESGLYHPVGGDTPGLLQVWDKGNTAYTMVHELMHFMTLDSKAAEEMKGSAEYKALEDIYNFLSSKKGKPVPISGVGNVSIENYGLTNFKEFMAELLINPVFRNYVADVFATNSREIQATSRAIRDSKATGIGELLMNWIKAVINKIFGRASGDVSFDEQKPAIDNAVKIAEELFFGGQSIAVDGSENFSPGKEQPMVEAPGSSSSLAYPDFNKDQESGKPTGDRIKVAPIEGITPKRISKIIFDVTKATEQRLFFLKPGRRNVSGTYSPGNTAIKIKYANDLDTTAHEIGHSLDDHFSIISDLANSPNPAVEKELRSLSDAGGSNPPKGYPDKRMYKLAEGLAEYVRGLVVNPDVTKSSYPNITKLYDAKVHPEYKKAIEEFSYDVRVFSGAKGADIAMANMQWEDKKPGWIANLFSKKSDGNPFSISFADRLKADYINPFQAFNKAIGYLKGINGIDELLPADDPKLLARAFLHIGAKVDSVFSDGMIDAQLNRLTDKDGNVKNLEWLISPLDNADAKTLEREMQETAAYMIAERTQELAERFQRDKRLTGLGGGIVSDVEKANQVLKDFDNYDKEKQDRIKEAAARYRELADDTLKYMVDKGRLSESVYNEIKDNNQYYVGLQRILQTTPDQEIESYRSKGGHLGSKGEPISSIKGSSQTIGNPYTNLIDTINKSIRESDRNEVLATFREILTGTRGMYEGDVQRFADIGVPGKSGDKNSIPIFIDGKVEHWVFQKDVYNVLKGIDHVSHNLPGFLTALPRLLRWSVTHFPVFAMRNIVRDTQQRLIISNENSLANLFGAKDFIGDSKHWEDVAIAGGLNAGFYLKDRVHWYGLMQEALKRMAKNKKVTTILNPSRIYKGYVDLLQKGETLNRVAEYRAAFKKAKGLGMDDYNAMLYAGNKSADLIDFALIGHKMKIINQLIPFSNAAVQGLRSSISKAGENPVGFTARMIIFTVLPQVALWYLNHSGGDDEEEYEDMPDYQRDMFWNLKVGPNNWVSIPKPFELGMLSSGVDRALSYSNGKKDAFDGYGGSVAKSFIPVDEAALGGPLRSVLEVKANYDFFRNKSIIPDYEENLDLRLRKTEYASKLGQLIGNNMGWDSRYVDYIVRSTLSYYGNFITKASNIGSDNSQQLGLPDLGFFKTSPAFNSKSVQDFLHVVKKYGISYKTPEVSTYRSLQQKYFSETTDEGKDQAARAIREYVKSVILSLKIKGEKDVLEELRKRENKKSTSEPAVPPALKR